MRNKKSILIFAGIISACSFFIFSLISLPYFLNFKHSIISNNTQDWGAFGSYIAGMAGIVNLGVFIILTIYIAKLGDANSNKQVETQKKIIISQFRQTEINKLNDQLDSAFNFMGYDRKEEILNAFSSVSIYLTNFLNQKQYLFPILKDKNVKNKIMTLLDKYEQLSLIVKEIHGLQPNEIESWKAEKLGTKIQFSIIIKNEIIEFLQTFVLQELEK